MIIQTDGLKLCFYLSTLFDTLWISWIIQEFFWVFEYKFLERLKEKRKVRRAKAEFWVLVFSSSLLIEDWVLIYFEFELESKWTTKYFYRCWRLLQISITSCAFTSAGGCHNTFASVSKRFCRCRSLVLLQVLMDARVLLLVTWYLKSFGRCQNAFVGHMMLDKLWWMLEYFYRYQWKLLQMSAIWFQRALSGVW